MAESMRSALAVAKQRKIEAAKSRHTRARSLSASFAGAGSTAPPKPAPWSIAKTSRMADKAVTEYGNKRSRARLVAARDLAARQDARRASVRASRGADFRPPEVVKPKPVTPPVKVSKVAPSAPPIGSPMRRDIRDISSPKPKGYATGLDTFGGGGRTLTKPPRSLDPRSTVVAQNIRYPETTTAVHKVSGYEFDPEIKTKPRDVLKTNAGRANRAWGKTWGDYFDRVDKAKRGKGPDPEKPTFKPFRISDGRVGNPKRKVPRIEGHTNAEATTVWRKGVDDRIMRAGGGTDAAAPETPNQAAQRAVDNADKRTSPGRVNRSDIIPTSSEDKTSAKRVVGGLVAANDRAFQAQRGSFNARMIGQRPEPKPVTVAESIAPKSNKGNLFPRWLSRPQEPLFKDVGAPNRWERAEEEREKALRRVNPKKVTFETLGTPVHATKRFPGSEKWGGGARGLGMLGFLSTPFMVAADIKQNKRAGKGYGAMDFLNSLTRGFGAMQPTGSKKYDLRG